MISAVLGLGRDPKSVMSGFVTKAAPASTAGTVSIFWRVALTPASSAAANSPGRGPKAKRWLRRATSNLLRFMSARYRPFSSVVRFHHEFKGTSPRTDS